MKLRRLYRLIIPFGISEHGIDGEAIKYSTCQASPRTPCKRNHSRRSTIGYDEQPPPSPALECGGNGEVAARVHVPEVPGVLALQAESSEYCARSLEDAGI